MKKEKEKATTAVRTRALTPGTRWEAMPLPTEQHVLQQPPNVFLLQQ
jgi:hypothetical protein